MKPGRCFKPPAIALADWYFEEGIGEDRAICVEAGEIVEAAIELPTALRAGAIHPARLVRILIPGRRGIAETKEGDQALLEPLPGELTEGAMLRIEIVREVVGERGRAKLAKARATTRPARPGLKLAERIDRFTRIPVNEDWFEQAGWSELLDQARSGEIGFPGGALRMSLTPAMTLFDVDGTLPPAALAVAGAAAAARAIRRLGITGSIGIDLPTLAAREERLAAAAALDELVPPPFERTAVNGFGFLQLVRRRERASIAEIVQGDPAGAAARALLRQAQRAPGHGPASLRAAPAVIDVIAQRPDWQARLERDLGAAIVLHPDEGLSISAGHVHRSLS